MRDAPPPRSAKTSVSSYRTASCRPPPLAGPGAENKGLEFFPKCGQWNVGAYGGASPEDEEQQQ